MSTEKDKMVQIYGLVNRQNRVIYVGQTSLALDTRLAAHKGSQPWRDEIYQIELLCMAPEGRAYETELAVMNHYPDLYNTQGYLRVGFAQRDRIAEMVEEFPDLKEEFEVLDRKIRRQEAVNALGSLQRRVIEVRADPLEGFYPHGPLVPVEGFEEKAVDVWEAYLKWCDDEMLPPKERWGRNTLYSGLEERGLVKVRTRDGTIMRGCKLEETA